MAITYAVGQRLTAELLQSLADYTVNAPLVRLVQPSTGSPQSLPHNTSTALQFGTGSTVYDTHNFHDESTNNTRITPTVAGYYEVNGIVFFNSRTDYTLLYASIGLNGSEWGTGPRLIKASTATGSAAQSQHITPLEVLMNGSTDYLELRAIQTNAASAASSVNGGVPFLSVFQCKFLRPA